MSSIAFACFDCRVAIKRDQDEYTIVCPTCKGTMYHMGWSFHAPKKREKDQWKKVQWLFAEGFRFYGSGWRTDIPLPKKYQEVKQFIKDNPSHALRTGERFPNLLPKNIKA